MEDQGTDGLSHSDQSRGVMQGIPLDLYVPLHLTPTERCPSIRKWIDDLVTGWNFKWLDTHEWYEEYHRDGNFVWDVAPAMEDLAYELVDKSIIKRSHTMYLILIPRLFTGIWRR